MRARREGSNVFYSIADERVLGVLELGEGILADNLEHVEACDITKDCYKVRAAILEHEPRDAR